MILDPAQVMVFMAAGIALNLTPGSDVMFCLGQGLKSGPRTGFAASLGIATGGAIHTLAAGLGLAAVLAAHPVAFEALKWAGVAYLVWLAVQAFRNPIKLELPQGVARSGAWQAWRDGTLVNLLNPKVIVFILAFLPQFVDPARGSSLAQFLLLGLIFNITGTVVNGAVGIGAGSVRELLVANASAARWLGYLSGTVFLALAAKLAFERR